MLSRTFTKTRTVASTFKRSKSTVRHVLIVHLFYIQSKITADKIISKINYI